MERNPGQVGGHVKSTKELEVWHLTKIVSEMEIFEEIKVVDGCGQDLLEACS